MPKIGKYFRSYFQCLLSISTLFGQWNQISVATYNPLAQTTLLILLAHIKKLMNKVEVYFEIICFEITHPLWRIIVIALDSHVLMMLWKQKIKEARVQGGIGRKRQRYGGKEREI